MFLCSDTIVYSTRVSTFGQIQRTPSAPAGEPSSSRRDAIKALTAPFLCLNHSPSAASSRSLRLLVPTGYAFDAAHRAFEEDSDLLIDVVTLNPRQHLATQWADSRADLCLSAGHNAPFWRARGLSAPWQLDALTNASGIRAPLMRTAMNQWRFDSDSPHWIPVIWGAEGIGWRNDMRDLPDNPSYRDVWERAAPGSTLIRPSTALYSIAYLLESDGDLPPGSVSQGEQSREAMRKAFAPAHDYMLRHSDRVKLMWNTAQNQIDGLLVDGAIQGQIWDMTAFSLRAVDEPVSFKAPIEGALAWSTGWLLHRDSSSKEAAHAFVNTLLSPRHAGAAVSDHGFHAAVRGAELFSPNWYRDAFRAAYDSAALERLRPVPQQPAWHRELIQFYNNRFLRSLAS